MHFKAGNSGQIDFFLFFHPPKSAYSDSKTVFRFWKNPKNTLFPKKWKIIKKHRFKGRKSGQIDFFLFFDPTNVLVMISKKFSDFEKSKKIQNDHLHTSLMGCKKKKKSIWPLLLPIKRHFLDFFHFLEKRAFFRFFLDFFKIRKLIWNQNRHIWGVKGKEKINLTTRSAFKKTFWIF